ncbi:unnamed protein product [Ostreobium quekettii]|uniref:Cytosolic carboxypeptidase N-terminal domain-containing protein n=1 Tax=Ostreobium quekettii TaxID=121088 RepID=A0A8S1IQI7_9CHLO|nr:unnamed protein product [Ostreobium quekettii]
MVSEMPEPELHWELPWRDQSKCSLPSAADCAGSRALELFPEMHDPARENASPTPAKSHDIRQVRHAVNIVDPPQRAKDMTKHFLDHPLPPEPLHWDGESVVPQMMMYMLQRLVNPSQLIQRVVFDNADIGAAGTSCSIPLCGGADDPHHSEARRINADGASPAVSKDIRLLQEELERWNSSGWRSLADGAPPSDPLAPPSAQPGARRAPIPDGCDGCMESPPQLGALGCRLNAWAQGGGSDRRSIGARRLGGGHGESPCVGKNGPLEVSACSPAVAEGDRCEAVGPGRGGWLECMRGHLAGEEGRGPDRLEFESRWECGNLRRAVQVYEHEYDLFLTSDVNENEDKGNRQWFLFSVRNATPGVQYRLNIVNFSKKASLYNSGTRPLMCSGQGEPLGNEQVECPLPLNGQQHSAGWHRIGEEVCYFPSPCRGRHAMHRKCAPKRITGKKKTGSKAQVKAVREGLTFDLPDVGPGLWCLSFVVSFPTAGSHYLAACYPYGYSDLKAFLDGSEANEAQSRQHHQQVVYRGLLSQTLQGHRCDLITITDFSASPEVMDRKEYVVVTARVHPGETSGSWVMQVATFNASVILGVHHS